MIFNQFLFCELEIRRLFAKEGKFYFANHSHISILQITDFHFVLFCFANYGKPQNQPRHPFVINCRVLNTKPSMNSYFIVFIIDKCAVLRNFSIHFAFLKKTKKCYLLIFMVLCYDYVLFFKLILKFLCIKGVASCFDIWQIINQCSPNCSEKGKGNIICRIPIIQVWVKFLHSPILL